MYICMYIWTYKFIRTHTHTHVYIYICVCECTHTLTHTHIFFCKDSNKCSITPNVYF